jgi:hypothetical protein
MREARPEPLDNTAMGLVHARMHYFTSVAMCSEWMFFRAPVPVTVTKRVPHRVSASADCGGASMTVHVFDFTPSLAILLANRLRKIVMSHAARLVPGRNESRWVTARKSVSCTKSSAPSIVPHNDNANFRRLGTFAKSSARMVRFNSMKSQILESIWI